MSETGKRIGWGEPITLNANQADAARNLMLGIYPGTGRTEYDQWKLLKGLLIPPVEVCKENRERIDRAADWIRGIDYVPEEPSVEYDEFEGNANNVLLEATNAYESRPEGCEMELSGDDDCFSCERCNFSRSTDTSF